MSRLPGALRSAGRGPASHAAAMQRPARPLQRLPRHPLGVELGQQAAAAASAGVSVLRLRLRLRRHHHLAEEYLAFTFCSSSSSRVGEVPGGMASTTPETAPTLSGLQHSPSMFAGGGGPRRLTPRTRTPLVSPNVAYYE